MDPCLNGARDDHDAGGWIILRRPCTKKNFIDMITLSFVAFALVSIQWVLIGYSLAFGPDVGGFIGNLQYLGLNNVGMNPGPYSQIIPGLLYMVFQLVFATVTMAIVTSGFAERIKFSSYLVFAALWTTIVYDPLAHWVWGGGWSSQFGAIDFAGGTVVHISSGFAALALALVIGKRIGYGKYSMEPAEYSVVNSRCSPPMVRLVRVQCWKRGRC